MNKIFESALSSKKTKQLLMKSLSLILILIISVLFLNVMLTGRDGRDSIVTKEGSSEYADNGKTSDEVRLENILSCISGVGNVQVMIKNSNEESSNNSSLQSVFNPTETTPKSTDESSAYGVIVVAGGASDFTVQSKIVDAVSTVCGISPSKVSVFEMTQKTAAENTNQ